MLCAALLQHGWPPLPGARSSRCSIGATLGLAMGCVIHYFEIQPFIVTLAGMFLARGCARSITVASISITRRVLDLRCRRSGSAIRGGNYVSTAC